MDHRSYQNGSARDAEQFKKLEQSLTTNIQKIAQNVLSMQKMVNQLGTPQESSQLKKQLHSIQQYTQQLVKDTSSHLQDLNRIQIPTTNEEQWKLKKERLTDAFTESLNNFQQAQRNALQKENEILRRDRANSGLVGKLPQPYTSYKSNDNLIELQNQANTNQLHQQTMEEELNLQAIEEQEIAINQLESDIIDVNQIFKDLGRMVHDQGERVDNIEAHVEQATTQVHTAAQELRATSDLATKVRKKKLCLFLTFLIVLIVLILIIVWSTR